MKRLLLAAMLAALPEPAWVAHKAVTARWPGQDTYADVLNHTARPYMSPIGRVNTAHETCHLLGSEIDGPASMRANRPLMGLYVGGDRAILLAKDVKFKVADVIVPPDLQGGIYQQYMVRLARHYDGNPLFILDEWNAYRVGTLVSVEDGAAGAFPEGGHQRMLEMTAYGLAVGMACERLDRDYWAGDFPRFVAWQAQQSLDLYERCSAAPNFAKDRTFRDKLLRGESGKPFRNFLGRLGVKYAP